MTAFADRRDFLKQLAVAGAGVGAASLGAWPGSAAAAGTVNWLAWGGHVEPQGLKSFFDSSGIRVNHISMSGNAETFAKLKLSGTAQYDLFEADGLWPVRYQQEGMIEPIDLDSIPNVAKHLHPEFKKIPALQSGGKMLIVPWGWNPTVLVYNKSKVSSVPASYEALLDPKYKGRIGFSDQHEFMWPAAAFLLGYQEPFRMNKAQLDKAKDILIRIKRNAPTISKGWNEQLRLYVEETVWIGLSSPGRAMTIQAASGPAMGWERPKEGYFGWIDGDMLVKGSPNREAALAWINHIHSPEYVAMNFKRLQRGAANRGGVELLKQQGMGDMVKANLMDQPDVALKMRLIEAPPNQDEYAAAWNEVLAA
jgi:spermidine/putrescine transport system substrate-binding protein